MSGLTMSIGPDQGYAKSALDPAYPILADGSSNDYTGLQAFVNANAGRSCWLPARTYLQLGVLTIPPNTKILSDGAVIKGGGLASPDKWWPGSGCEFRGLSFQDRVTGIAHDYSSGSVTDILVENCSFANVSRAVNADSNIGGSINSGWIVRGNKSTGCPVFFLGQPCDDMLVEGNEITSSGAGHQPILFYGGKRNRVIANRLKGQAITGIEFLWNPSLVASTQGRGLIQGNVISGNVITDVAEESISFDGLNAVRDTDIVSSTTVPARVTLSASGWSAAGSAYVGYFMVFYSGALAGQAFLITDQSNGLFTLDISTAQLAAASIGDKVSVGGPAMRNTVIGNVIESATAGDCTQVALYGMTVGNTVSGNTCKGNRAQAQHQHGIAIRALSGLAKATPTYANNPGSAPSCFNSCTGNTIEDADIEADLFQFGAGELFQNPGTIVSGNTIRNGRVHVSYHTVSVTASNAAPGVGSCTGNSTTGGVLVENQT